MINPDPFAGSAAVAVAGYEDLRSHVLAGSPRGGQFGLVVLLREGVAAWIDHCAACFPLAARSAAPDRALSAPLVSPQLHADIVRVLASIALTVSFRTPLTDREEMNL